MASVGTLSINVVANTALFNAGLHRASRQVGVFTGTVGKSLRVLTPFSSMFGAGLTFGGAFALVSAGKSVNDFTGEMNRSLAIMQNVGPKMRAEMERLAHSIAFKTEFSPREVAKSYFFLASAGLSAKQSMASALTVATFAQAGHFDLARATELATDAQSALGLKVQNTAKNLQNLTRVTDVLVKANRLADATTEQFAEALGTKAGADLRLFGKGMEEGVAVLAAFADQSIKGTEAGTKFHIMMRDLTSKAIINADAFRKANIAVFEYGEMRNLADIIEDIEDKLSGMSDELKKSTLLQLGFADKSVAAVTALLGFSGKIREWESALLKAGGTSKEVADKNLTNLDKAWNKVSASMSLMANEAFPPVLDGLAKIMESIGFVEDAAKSLNGTLGNSDSGWKKFGEGARDALDVVKGVVADIKLAAAQAEVIGDPKFVAATLLELGGKGTAQSKAVLEAGRRELRRASLEHERTFMDPRVVADAEKVQRDKAEDRERRKRNLDFLREFKTGRELISAGFSGSFDKGDIFRDFENQFSDKFGDMSGIFSGAEKGVDKVVRVLSTMRGIHENLAAAEEEAGAARKRIWEQTRTAAEKYETTLRNINDLFSENVSGKSSTPEWLEASGRAVEQATKTFEIDFQAELDAKTPPAQQRFTPGLTPALEAGSVAAAEAIARAMQTSFPVSSIDATAKNTAVTARNSNLTVQLMEQIKRMQSKPGTVETAAQ